jgi:hypothetical protein
MTRVFVDTAALVALGKHITHYDRNQVVRLMLELRAENPDIWLEGAGRSARYSVECARK